MKVRVVKGTVNHNGKSYGIGKEFQVKADEGKRLINKGVAVDPDTLEEDEEEDSDPKDIESSNQEKKDDKSPTSGSEGEQGKVQGTDEDEE